LYSDVERGTWGGPWQAQDHKCRYFVYYFKSHDIAYVFETDDLLRQIDQYVMAHHPLLVEVKNKSWVSAGYKAARSAFKPLRILRGKP
jgi:hypothetical protein